jgi:hypothetical protein
MLPKKEIVPDITEEAILEDISIVEECKRLSDRCDAIIERVKIRKIKQMEDHDRQE